MIKHISLLIIATLLLSFQSCITEEIEDLPYNVFEDSDSDLITITSHTYDGWVLKVFFDVHVENENNIVVFRNGIVFRTMSSDRSSFTINNFASSNTCFTIAFVSKDGDYSRKCPIYCVS